jgi:nucleoside-diphosphate-sugar epimerase
MFGLLFCLSQRGSLAFTPSLSSRTTLPRSSSALYSTPAKAVYDKVFVAGGSRGVGRAIIDRLLSTHTAKHVVALIRSEEGASSLLQTLSQDKLTVIRGDAFDYKTVEHAMDGCDAAITTLGGTTALPDGSNKRIDYEGNNNVIEAAGILGCTRLVLVTSIGCGTSKEATPPNVYQVLQDVLKAKERAENVLIKYYTNMNWTIIRPGGLKSEPRTGKAILTEEATRAIGSIHREDVADLVVQALVSTKTERKIFSAVDPSISGAGSTPLSDALSFQAFALK